MLAIQVNDVFETGWLRIKFGMRNFGCLETKSKDYLYMWCDEVDQFLSNSIVFQWSIKLLMELYKNKIKKYIEIRQIKNFSIDKQTDEKVTAKHY